MSDNAYIATCLLGLEGLVAGELREMGATNVEASNGSVSFSGDSSTLARANICSRYSERILVLIGRFKAASFEELFDQTVCLPWENYINKKDQFPVKGWSIDSKLHSVPDCQSIIKKAVVERLKSKYNVSWFEETGALYRIQFSIMKDTVTIMIDSSGEGLHKRGYRPQAAIAPIKETIAAAMSYLSKIYDDSNVYDPFCGSGTIVIESALIATNTAPGLNRSFTAENWDMISSEVWRQERSRALDLIKRDIKFFAVGTDIDDRAVELAKHNAKKAGMDSKTQFVKKDVKDFEFSTERGIVICNPPYGERLMDKEQAENIYKLIGEIFVKKKGWRYGIICAHEEFEKIFGRKADKRRKLYNGMIKCQFYQFFKN